MHAIKLECYSQRMQDHSVSSHSSKYLAFSHCSTPCYTTHDTCCTQSHPFHQVCSSRNTSEIGGFTDTHRCLLWNWYNQALLPYRWYQARFPAYLEQSHPYFKQRFGQHHLHPNAILTGGSILLYSVPNESLLMRVVDTAFH